MRTPPLPRLFHGVTFAVATGAILLQLVLVLLGHSPLAPELRPGTGEAVRRFFSYFTIQSNLLVAATTFGLAFPRGLDTRLWAVTRLASIVGITVTGVVHFLILRPILHLEGIDWWADLLLHVVVPILTVLGWLTLGPHGTFARADAARALVWPVLWLAATLALGPVVDWYPYPFLDISARGLGPVLTTSIAIGILFGALALIAVALDRRLARSHRGPHTENTAAGSRRGQGLDNR